MKYFIVILASVFWLLASGFSQTIQPPANRSQVTNMVANGYYVSPSGLGDFYNFVLIPYVASHAGSGSGQTNWSWESITNKPSVITNNQNGVNLFGAQLINGTLTSSSGGDGFQVSDGGIFSFVGTVGGFPQFLNVQLTNGSLLGVYSGNGSLLTNLNLANTTNYLRMGALTQSGTNTQGAVLVVNTNDASGRSYSTNLIGINTTGNAATATSAIFSTTAQSSTYSTFAQSATNYLGNAVYLNSTNTGNFVILSNYQAGAEGDLIVGVAGIGTNTFNFFPSGNANFKGTLTMNGLLMQNGTNFAVATNGNGTIGNCAATNGALTVPSGITVSANGITVNSGGVAANNSTISGANLSSGGVIRINNPQQPTSAILTSQGLVFGTDGTNAWVIFRNGAGVFTTNKLTLSAWP